MDLALFIKSRLEELGLEQKDLAVSAQVTESYISQLLARKKSPPLVGRTEIYARMSRFLKLPEGKLSAMADLQRRERLKRIVSEQLRPLHSQCRQLLLSKCVSSRRREVRLIFERESFGELERLITQTFLAIAKDQLGDEEKIRLMAELSGQTVKQMRAHRVSLLESELYNISDGICVSFLNPLIEWWDVDLKTFRVDLQPNRKLIDNGLKQFKFVETGAEQPDAQERGLQEFLADASLSGDATEEELRFLKTLKFKGRQPTRIYYYRQLQNLRDPLNFGAPLPQKRSSMQRKG